MKNRIKVLRAERGITQDKLAAMCQVSRSSINAIEKERVIPNGDTMLRISRALCIPIHEIFLDFSLCSHNISKT